MSTRPRTRDHFPRMKVRGHRRRHYLRSQQLQHAMHLLAAIDWEGIARRVDAAITAYIDTMNTFARAVTIPDGYRLEPDTTPLLTTTASAENGDPA